MTATKLTDGRTVPLCPASGKIRWASEAAARQVIDEALLARVLHGNMRRRETHCYRCLACRGWHTTSHPKQGGGS